MSNSLTMNIQITNMSVVSSSWDFPSWANNKKYKLEYKNNGSLSDILLVSMLRCKHTDLVSWARASCRLNAVKMRGGLRCISRTPCVQPCWLLIWESKEIKSFCRITQISCCWALAKHRERSRGATLVHLQQYHCVTATAISIINEEHFLIMATYSHSCVLFCTKVWQPLFETKKGLQC